MPPKEENHINLHGFPTIPLHLQTLVAMVIPDHWPYPLDSGPSSKGMWSVQCGAWSLNAVQSYHKALPYCNHFRWDWLDTLRNRIWPQCCTYPRCTED